MKQAQCENWKRLFDATIKINQLKPWEKTQPEDLLILHLEKYTQPIVVCIIGQEENCFGVITYTTPKSQKILSNMLFETMDIVDMLSYDVSHQEALACYFNDRNDLSKEDYQLIKDLDYSFRGKGNWPSFVSLITGRIPQQLSDEEVCLLADTFEALLPTLTNLSNQTKKTYTHIKEENNTLSTYEAPFDLYNENTLTKKTFKDDILIRQLANKSRLQFAIELTYFYTNQIDEEGNIMVMIMGTDAHSEMVLFFHIVPSTENMAEVVLQQLISFIKEQGRPISVTVRLEDLYCELEDFCEKLSIQLRVDEDLDSLESACLEVMDFIQ